VSVSHQRKSGPGAPHNHTPEVIAHAPKGEYAVLSMAPQYPGGPTFAVCIGRESVALFFDRALAEEFCKWKNQTS
jgi:hypothetical protein